MNAYKAFDRLGWVWSFNMSGKDQGNDPVLRYGAVCNLPSYFDRTREDWRYFDFPPTYSFHRTLSDYIKALVKNGFTITDLEEPVPSQEDMEEHYREFGNEYDRIPWFLIIGARK